MIVVVVYDILHVVSSHHVIDVFSTHMSSTYSFKDLEVPSVMIDVNIVVTNSSISFDQSHYICSLV